MDTRHLSFTRVWSEKKIYSCYWKYIPCSTRLFWFLFNCFNRSKNRADDQAQYTIIGTVQVHFFWLRHCTTVQLQCCPPSNAPFKKCPRTYEFFWAQLYFVGRCQSKRDSYSLYTISSRTRDINHSKLKGNRWFCCLWLTLGLLICSGNLITFLTSWLPVLSWREQIYSYIYH